MVVWTWLHKLYDWQAFASGLLATLAALIGAWFLNQQIQQNEAHQQDQIRRRLRAAMIASPLTLNALMEWAMEQAETLLRAIPLCTNESLPEAEVLNVRLPPSDVIMSIERIAEAASDNKLIETLSMIVQDIQVFVARSSPRPGFVVSRQYLIALLLDLCVFYNRVGSIFDVARGRGQAAVAREDLYRVPLALIPSGAIYEELNFQMSRRQQRHADRD